MNQTHVELKKIADRLKANDYNALADFQRLLRRMTDAEVRDLHVVLQQMMADTRK